MIFEITICVWYNSWISKYCGNFIANPIISDILKGRNWTMTSMKSMNVKSMTNEQWQMTNEQWQWQMTDEINDKDKGLKGQKEHQGKKDVIWDLIQFLEFSYVWFNIFFNREFPYIFNFLTFFHIIFLIFPYIYLYQYYPSYHYIITISCLKSI